MMTNLFPLLLVSTVCFFAASQPTTYIYKTVGNLSIEANVYLPNATLYDKYPVVLAIHGGGFVVGTKLGALSTQELGEILSRGWVAVSIDYRLSPGALLYEIVEDVQDAYEWIRTGLVRNISIDPDCITIFGGSAGGGLALISGYQLFPRPKAIISFYPFCSNFTGLYTYNPITPVSGPFIAEANSLRQPVSQYSIKLLSDPRLVLFLNSLIEEKSGWLLTTSNPNESIDIILALLTEYSAAFNVDDNYPPTYLSHGLNDTLVPFEQSVQMADQLKLKNIPYKLDLVPGANHVFDLNNPSQEIWQEHILPAFDFVQQYMLSKEQVSF